MSILFQRRAIKSPSPPLPQLLDAYPGVLGAFTHRTLSDSYLGNEWAEMTRQIDGGRTTFNFLNTGLPDLAGLISFSQGERMVIRHHRSQDTNYYIRQAFGDDRPYVLEAGGVDFQRDFDGNICAVFPDSSASNSTLIIKNSSSTHVGNNMTGVMPTHVLLTIGWDDPLILSQDIVFVEFSTNPIWHFILRRDVTGTTARVQHETAFAEIGGLTNGVMYRFQLSFANNQIGLHLNGQLGAISGGIPQALVAGRTGDFGSKDFTGTNIRVRSFVWWEQDLTSEIFNIDRIEQVPDP